MSARKVITLPLARSTGQSLLNHNHPRVTACGSLGMTKSIATSTKTTAPASFTTTTLSHKTSTGSNIDGEIPKLRAETPRAIHLDTIQSTSPYHFYENEILEKYASQPVNASTLRQFIFFGRQMNTERLIRSGNWVREELLVRLAHRIRDFQQLPFFVGTNPHIEYVYKMYWGAFKSIRSFPAINTHEDNIEFCQLLRNLLEDGLLVLPQLAQGISESAHFYQDPAQKDLDLFLNRMLRSYISRRVIAEQHLALTEACEHQWDLHTSFGGDDGYVGIIFTHCSASEILKRAQQLVFQHVERYHRPCDQMTPSSSLLPTPPTPPPPKIEITIQNNTGITTGHRCPSDEILFAYVPEQLERILYELLDNAVRFTMLKHTDGNYPPIKVTVSANEADVYFRVSDQGGGMSSQRYEQLWSYQSRSQMGEFNEIKQVSKVPVAIDERVNQASEMGHRHLGLGLTMSRIYAEYWGGELQVIPMDGFGTDAYVRIPRLGTNAENLGIGAATTNHRHPVVINEETSNLSKYTNYTSKIPKHHLHQNNNNSSKHRVRNVIRANHDEKSTAAQSSSRKTIGSASHLSASSLKFTIPEQSSMTTHAYSGNGWSESRMIKS